MDEASEIAEVVHVDNENLDELTQRYAGAQATLEATSNYYYIHDTLPKHLDVTVAHPKELNRSSTLTRKLIASMPKNSREWRGYIRCLRVRSNWRDQARVLVRGRQT